MNQPTQAEVLEMNVSAPIVVSVIIDNYTGLGLHRITFKEFSSLVDAQYFIDHTDHFLFQKGVVIDRPVTRFDLAMLIECLKTYFGIYPKVMWLL